MKQFSSFMTITQTVSYKIEPIFAMCEPDFGLDTQGPLGTTPVAFCVPCWIPYHRFQSSRGAHHSVTYHSLYWWQWCACFSDYLPKVDVTYKRIRVQQETTTTELIQLAVRKFGIKVILSGGVSRHVSCLETWFFMSRSWWLSLHTCMSCLGSCFEFLCLIMSHTSWLYLDYVSVRHK